jgi:hypothetical protein
MSRAALVVLVLALILGSVGPPHPGAVARMADGPDMITAPANGASVSGAVEIRGRATGPDVSRFAYYRILIGEGAHPPTMRPLGPPYDKPVDDGVLAIWDTDRFPPGEYTLTLQVYDVANDLTSASVLVTVSQKPTPTPFAAPAVLGTPIDVAPPGPGSPPGQTGPIPSAPDAAPAGDGAIPINLPTPFAPPTLAPLPVESGPSDPGVPINPIPIDPNSPPPVRLDTPAQTDPSQLPFAPAPVYITPVEFNP